MVKYTKVSSIKEKDTDKVSATLIINAFIKDCGSLVTSKMPNQSLGITIRQRATKQVRVKLKWVVILVH